LGFSTTDLPQSAEQLRLSGIHRFSKTQRSRKSQQCNQENIPKAHLGLQVYGGHKAQMVRATNRAFRKSQLAKLQLCRLTMIVGTNHHLQ